MLKIMACGLPSAVKLARTGLLAALVLLLCLGFSGSAIADTIDDDPIGFCAPPATVPACTTATGLGHETIGVGTTAIGMEKNGSGTSDNPWYLILALPNYSGSAPTITNQGTASDPFTVSSVSAGAQYLQSSPNLYIFTGTIGDGSMNASNMFGANEVAAFGSTPSFFDVFVYTMGPGLDSWTPYEFD